MAAAGGVVLSEAGAFGVAFVDAEVVSLAGGRGGKFTLQTKHLGLSQSMERWSAPHLEHGYAILGPGDGAPDVGVAARTSLGICCGWSRVRLPWRLMIDEGASWYAA